MFVETRWLKVAGVQNPSYWTCIWPYISFYHIRLFSSTAFKIDGLSDSIRVNWKDKWPDIDIPKWVLRPRHISKWVLNQQCCMKTLKFAAARCGRKSNWIKNPKKSQFFRWRILFSSRQSKGLGKYFEISLVTRSLTALNINCLLLYFPTIDIDFSSKFSLARYVRLTVEKLIWGKRYRSKRSCENISTAVQNASAFFRRVYYQEYQFLLCFYRIRSDYFL